MSAVRNTDLAVRTAYETDASGLHLCPDAVVRPSTDADVMEVLRHAYQDRTPVTPAGGQTSTTGASITDTGILLSLRGMNTLIDLDVSNRIARVQPGVLVADLKRVAAAEGLLFAPDPTSEQECTIGGAIACNASGARTFKYGPTRPHVRALRVALADGEVMTLRRSALEKNTVGYAVVHDPIDWFIGSEGTLGVILEAELALLPLPQWVVGLAIPFTRDADALDFIVAARESTHVTPRCLEYFDERALAIARGADNQPGWAATASALVYVEQEIADSVEPALEQWLILAEQYHAHDDLRVFDGEAQLRHARAIRHAVPATMNERGARQRGAGGRKVSTDWAVPYRQLHGALATARGIAEKYGIPQAVSYGHAGNGHPHQNFIAHDAAELKVIEQVVTETLQEVIRLGGTVAAEHGIGKLKRHWVSLQMTPLQINMMHAVKRELDPNGILAPGNIL